MKTEKPHMAFRAHLHLIVLLCFSFFITSNSYSNGVKTYRFCNNENMAASDLHIEFDGQVDFHTGGAGTDPTVESPANTFKDGSDNGSTNPSKINLANGFGGAGVAAGACVTLTFDYTGTDIPNVKSWYWTKSNNLNPSPVEADTLGRPKSPRKQCYDLVMAPATGNGALMITIGGVNYPITLTAGMTGAQNALNIVNFINSVAFGIAKLTGATSFTLSSAANSGSAADFNSVIVQQDATQTITTLDCTNANAIPSLPEWGLIILGILFLSIGILYLKRIF